MLKSTYFLSLKWKFALFFGIILIALYSLYSYFAYDQAVQNFAQSRVVAVKNKINIAHVLTQESFLTLDRFSASVALMHKKAVMQASADQDFIHSMMNNTETEQQLLLIIQLFNDHWQEWQDIWGLENFSVYNQYGTQIKNWGGTLHSTELIAQVLAEGQIKSQIICPQQCFQVLITPIFSDTELVGAVSTSISLSGILKNYQAATHSNIGVINSHKERAFSVINYTDKDKQVTWQDIQASYSLDALIQKTVSFEKQGEHYELRAFPVSQQQAPYYLIINNITQKYKHLQNKFSALAIAMTSSSAIN